MWPEVRTFICDNPILQWLNSIFTIKTLDLKHLNINPLVNPQECNLIPKNTKNTEYCFLIEIKLIINLLIYWKRDMDENYLLHYYFGSQCKLGTKYNLKSLLDKGKFLMWNLARSNHTWVNNIKSNPPSLRSLYISYLACNLDSENVEEDVEHEDYWPKI